jgi:hypothetical protein
MKKLHYEHKNEMCKGMEKKFATFLKETVEVKQRKLSFLEKKLALEESKSIRRIGQEIVILVIGTYVANSSLKVISLWIHKKYTDFVKQFTD